MEEKDYKQEITQSRLGSLGSSDGKMLAQICSLGSVPKSAYKRLAVCKGLIPQTEIPHTAAVKAGDEIEMAIYRHISKADPRYESNPLWVSKKYSRKNVRLISHPDYVLKDDSRKTLFIYECKATKNGVMETRETYKGQLYIHYVLGKELAAEYGSGWNVKLFLVHYDTNGLELENGVEFEESRLTIKEIRFPYAYFDVALTMTIVDDFLETFTEYYEGDEIDADLLPVSVKTEFDEVAAMLIEIDERQKHVDAFKKKLYTFMAEKGIKSLKNDVFSIVRVDPTKKKSFDSKSYMDDLAKEHPRKAKRIMVKYTKTSETNGYVKISVNKKK